MMRHWLKLSIMPLLVVGFVVVFGWYVLHRHHQAATPAVAITPTPTGVRLDASKMKLIKAPTQHAAISATATAKTLYDNPYLQHVRTALTAYLAGQKAGIANSAIATSSAGRCGLDVFSSDYYRSPFFYFQAKNSQSGGLAADIVFTKKPDAIFEVHVDRLATGEYQLVSFCKVGPQPGREAVFESTVKKYLVAGNLQTL